LNRVPQVIAQTSCISITKSALTQSAGKLCEDGGLLQAHYTNLRRRVVSSAVVNTDDTGWRVSATLAFLMGFFIAMTPPIIRSAPGIGIKSYRKRGREIAAKLDHQLRKRPLSDADNRRLLRGIAYKHERGRLAFFLERHEVEPTNNRAERGLRPAVIARKVSQCSKNERGAQTYAVMKTLFTTLRLRCKDTVNAFAALLRGASMPLPCEG